MKAIERAAFWTQSLESVGFDIDCQTEERWGATYLTVNAQKDRTRLNYVIRMDTPRTRFICGASTFCSATNYSNKANQMSSFIQSAILFENYKIAEGQTA